MIQSANHLAAAYNQAETGQDAHKHHNLIYADHGMDVGSRWLIWEFLLISSFMYNRLEFTQSGANNNNNKTSIEQQLCVDNALLMRVVRGELPDWFMLT